tara:strand:- start:392 stop:1114 length:723 start_codon:yes stop_codon:yes gene_type:complete
VATIKCVIAAGGLGTRLKNFRDNDTTKMLLEVNGMPMINRQITQLMKWGMEDFIIISNPEFEELTKEVTKTKFPDINIEFVIQETQDGISHALYQARPHLSKEDITVFVLGDNFFQGNPLESIDFKNDSIKTGSYIFTYDVENPSDFGVAQLDENNNVVSIEEKPEHPKSNHAIVGVYVFDDTVINKIETLEPSERGEYEITDLITLYINESKCVNVEISGWWIDAGTPERIEELESKLS